MAKKTYKWETTALTSLTQHPNVVHLIEAFSDEEGLCVAFEYAAGGDLFDFVKRKGRVGEEEARIIFLQILEGVGFAHEKGYVHRDLKLENIYLVSSDSHHLVIGDWGFASQVFFSPLLFSPPFLPSFSPLLFSFWFLLN